MSAIVMSGEENVLHHTATQPGSTDGQPGPVDDLGVINGRGTLGILLFIAGMGR